MNWPRKRLKKSTAIEKFSISLPWGSCLWLLASMCLITFADPASSTIGIKFGKHRFSWNKKSLEGVIAGTAAAFATMYVFVGLVYAILGALGFAFIDLITPKPVQISDNMAMPLICTTLFVVLSLIGIPAQNYLGW
jgi:dolichol kinase